MNHHHAPRRLLVETLSVYVLAVVFLGLYSYGVGQDLNWDQLNYHFYSGWAVHHRLTSDLFAVGMQTYLNHFGYVPFYHLVTSFRPITAATLMTCMQALNAPLIFLLARMTLQIEQSRLLIFTSTMACLVGLRSPLFLSEVGGSFTDALNGVPFLVALIVALFGVFKDRTLSSSIVCTVAAGVLFGVLAATKLVNLVFAIGFVVAIAVSCRTITTGIALVASACLSLLVGLAVPSAHLMRVLWREFGNPLFPFYNGLFKSPYWIAGSFSDTRWAPKSFADGLSYPFQWVIGLSPSNELPFQDTRFAIVILLLLAVAVVGSVQTFGKGYLEPGTFALRDNRLVAPIPFRFCSAFFFTSFLVWLFMFGVQRYLVPLELLTGVMMLILIDFAVPGKAAKLALLTSLSLVGALVIKIPNWGRVPWQAEWYSVHLPPAFTVENSLYLILSEPLGYLFPFLPKSSHLVRVLPKTFYGDKGKLYQRTQDIVRSYNGQRYMIIGRTDFEANRASLGGWLSEWGFKAKFNSCTAMDSRPGGFVMCMLEPLQLAISSGDLAHLGFGEALGPEGYRVALPFSYGKAFSAELLLAAGASQSRYATILSNHPGSKDFHGVFIDTENGTNSFRVALGSGSDWMPCGSFTLQPEKRTYLALTTANQQCSLYVDGVPAAKHRFRTAPSDSDYAMTVGDWGAPGRQFSGSIQEIRLSHQLLSASEVYATAKRIKVIP